LSLNPHPDYEVFPNPKDVTFWKVLMKGPSSTPYAGGVWLLYVNYPETFPLDAPEVRFYTPIVHCNVSPHMKICHSIFNRNWTSDTTMSTLLNCVYGLLLTPETSDPVDTNLSGLYYNDKKRISEDN